MPDKKITDLRDRWDEIRAEHTALENESTEGLGPDDPKVKDQEARIAALDVRKDALAETAWAIRARDLADLTLLAELAFDRFFELSTFPQVLNLDTSEDYDELAVGYLIKGVMDVGEASAAHAVPVAVPVRPARREPPEALIAEIDRLVMSVMADEAAIGVLSTGEAIAVAAVLNRADLLPHGGYTWLEAVDRLGPEWLAAAQAVQRQRDVA